MNDEHDFSYFNDLVDSEESSNDLEADMYGECTIGESINFPHEEENGIKDDFQGNDVLDELEGMRPQRRIVFTEVEEGEMSGNGIPLDPQESERMKEMFNKQDENYLVYYTKCVIYLMQKYGALTTKQMASLIGNLEAKQLYDIINGLCEYKIISRGSSEDGYMFRFCTDNVPNPISDINYLEDEILIIKSDIQRIQAHINEIHD